MKDSVQDEQYRELEALRYHLRVFYQQSEIAARDAGVEHQQYQALLAIRGLSSEGSCTIRALADRLLLKHHSMVELLDRMEAKRLVGRSRDHNDRRQVFVRLLPKGERLLSLIVKQRLQDITVGSRDWLATMQALVERPSAPAARSRFAMKPEADGSSVVKRKLKTA